MKLNKMISILFFIITSSALVYTQCPGGGELKICVTNPNSNKFYLSIESAGYCWDYINSQIVLVPSFERSFDTVFANYRFDAPKDKGSNIDAIPWGRFKIKIASHNRLDIGIVRSFYLDLRDENWSQGTTYSDYQRDTWIMIDQKQDSEKFTFGGLVVMELKLYVL